MKTLKAKFLIIPTCLILGCTNLIFCQSLDYEHANLSFYRDKAGQKQRIETAADWQKRRDQILLGMQQAMGKFPENRSKEYTVHELGSRVFDKFTVKTIRLSVTAKSQVVADLYLPKSVTSPSLNKDRPSSNKKNKTPQKLPAILALHPTGQAGKRIIGGDSPRKNRQYANELARRGYIVFAPDYPSFGELKSHDFGKDGFDSGTMQGIVNHMRCVDYLESLEIVDRKKIGVIGHSLGGHNSIFVAAFDPRLKAIVTSCGWTPFHDYYGGKIAGWTSDRYMPLLKTRFHLDPDQVPFDFYELIAALAPRPFYTNSPLHDANFDVEGIKKAIPKIKQIYSLFGAEHQVATAFPKCDHDFPTEIRAEAYRFLDRVFDHQPTEDVGFGGELPRIAPLEPADALKSFNRPDLQLVASEPLVHDPIAMSFDEHQRLFVIEMKGYSEQADELRGRVRMLVDEDRDGIYEKSTIYADRLSWPTALICYDGGVFVGAAPDIWYFKDTDQDGKADLIKKIFTGFGKSNVQGLMNCFRWGLDNRIHGATSSSGGKVYRVGGDPKQAVDLRGRDFSFDPRTLSIRAETGGAQHGMCFDDFGNKFVCSNSDHAQAVLFADRYLARNPYFRGSRARVSIAADGGQAPVFRISPVEPWRIVRTRLRVARRVPGPVEGGGTAAGYFTGSTGITIYRGDAKSVDKGTAIIGDVGSNIVHRKKIERDGLKLTATRLDRKSELVASSDNWFRPAQFGNAPDGCLYILDMYREVIEHPKSLPPSIKQHLDLTFGRDRGRIYRLGKPKLNRVGDLNPSLSSTELVAFLNHPNSWHRETAARLIFQNQDITCVPALQTVRVQDFGPVGRIHALYALDGLKRLKLDDLVIATKDSHPEVRRHTLILAESNNPDWLLEPAIAKLADDRDQRVRLQMAFAIGEVDREQRRSILWRLIQKSDGHPLMTTAIMSSANGLQTFLIEKLAGSKLNSTRIGQELFRSLTDQIARRNRPADFKQIEQLIVNLALRENHEFARRLAFNVSSANDRMRQQLLSSKNLEAFLSAQLKSSLETAQNPQTPVAKRVDSIRFLRLGLTRRGLSESDNSNLQDTLVDLISVEQPLQVQLAAVQTLGTTDNLKVAESLIGRRKFVGRETAVAITELLLSKSKWVHLFLQAAKPADLTAGQIELLKKSSNAETRRLATALSSQIQSPKTELLVQSYKRSLTLLGDVASGKKVFQQHCSKCHRANGTGFEIGPNLAAMKARGKAAVLANVLDPNREVNPAYLNYLVQTNSGRTFTGMIAHESSTALTLKQEQNKLIEISKSDIEAIKNSGLSLMPVGLEKEISVEQMADLLEFLMIAK